VRYAAWQDYAYNINLLMPPKGNKYVGRLRVGGLTAKIKSRLGTVPELLGETKDVLTEFKTLCRTKSQNGGETSKNIWKA